MALYQSIIKPTKTLLSYANVGVGQFIVDTYDATKVRYVEYMVVVEDVDKNSVYSVKLQVFHNGRQSWLVQYNEVSDYDLILDFEADYNSTLDIVTVTCTIPSTSNIIVNKEYHVNLTPTLIKPAQPSEGLVPSDALYPSNN